MKEVVLPSGKKLQISPSPFAVSRNLYQAICDELRDMKIDEKADMNINFFKDIFCTFMASKKIESALNECMKRATYNGVKIGDDTWEPVEAREDYIEVCYEITRENVLPFVKSLFARYSHILETMQKIFRA